MINIIDYSEKAIAVTGDTKDLKEHFKALGGRFNPRLTCGAGWIFSKAKRAQIDALAKGDIPTPKPQATQKDIFLTKEEIRESFMAYGNNKGSDLEWLCKKHPLGVRLSDGNIVLAEKEDLQTAFCFGYGCNGMSTQAETRAAYDCADAVKRNQRYFVDENLKGLREIVKRLKTGKDSDGYTVYTYLQQEHIYESNRRSIYFSHHTIKQMKDGWGSPWLINRWKENGLTEINEQDKKLLIKLYETALEKRTKRVNTYLKRYGLSKIRTWTYLSD